MAITINPARNEYTATAGQTIFNYTFKIFQASDLNVYVTPAGQTANDATDITLDYVVDPVSIGDENGGFITFNLPQTAGDLVTIISNIPDNRTTDYQTNGDFIPDTVNNDFDRVVSLVKQVQDNIDRRVAFQESAQGKTGLTIDEPAALNFLRWKTDETGLENVDAEDIATAITFSDFNSDQYQDGVDFTAGVTTQLILTNSAGILDNTQVYFDGVYVEKTEYTLTGGTQIDFNVAIPGGTAVVEIVYGTAVTQQDIENSVAAAAASEAAAAASAASASTDAGTASAAAAAASTSETNAATSESNAATSAANASTSETNAATSETNAGTSETNAAASAQLAEDWAESPTEPGGPGSKSAKTWAEEAGTIVGSAATQGSATRNTVLNQEPMSQAQSQRVGFSATGYAGTGAIQSIANGIDMATGDLGGFTWIKNRDTTDGHFLCDTVRGSTFSLSSESTAAEVSTPNGITAFTATGFDLGTSSSFNRNATNIISWSFQTTKRFTGTTNRNKTYTAHYNPQMGFSVVGYEGDGVDGHEIPHHLGAAPELRITKNRDIVNDWSVASSFYDSAAGEFLKLNDTGNIFTSSTASVLLGDQTCQLGTLDEINGSTNNHISYHFRSIPGFSKVGKYIGTGAAGNYVDCGFKPAFVVVKNLTSADSWVVWDSGRGEGSILLIDTSGAESAVDVIDFVDDGFVFVDGASNRNGLNNEYLFLAFSDNNVTTGRGEYDFPTTADTIDIVQDTLISFAEGFNEFGEVNSIEQVPASTTLTLGAGFEDKTLYVYKDKAGSFLTTEVRPLEGVTRNSADTFGEVSPLDPTLRTTARHFDYESSTGVALASSESSGAAYEAFDKNVLPVSSGWRADSEAVGAWIQYKFSESRVLKTVDFFWEYAGAKGIDIELSNDGFNWTLDQNYSVTSGVRTRHTATIVNNTQLWRYVRFTFTVYVGSVVASFENIELNTVLPADYYLVGQGLMFDSADTEISRVYLGKVITDTDGDVNIIDNFSVAPFKATDAVFYGDVTFEGEVLSLGEATAWVNFDGTQNPPLIRSSFNIADVVDLGAGRARLIFETPMDSEGYVCVGSNRQENTIVSAGGDQTVTGIEVQTTNTAGTLTDSTHAEFLFFGGKTIGG